MNRAQIDGLVIVQFAGKLFHYLNNEYENEK